MLKMLSHIINDYCVGEKVNDWACLHIIDPNSLKSGLSASIKLYLQAYLCIILLIVTSITSIWALTSQRARKGFILNLILL